MINNLKENRRRIHRIQVRLDDDEYDYFCYNVKRTGLTKEAYLRTLIDGKIPKLREELDVDKEIVSQLYAIGNNLNQIARRAHTLGRIDIDRYDKSVENFKKIMIEFIKRR